MSGTPTFTGTLVPFATPVELIPGIREQFLRGAFRDACTNPARAKVQPVNHGKSAPIGRAVELEERPHGLWCRFTLADTPAGHEARTLLTDGTIDELSIEFRSVPGGSVEAQVGPDSYLVTHKRVRLFGFSPVSHGAYGRHAKLDPPPEVRAVLIAQERAFLDNIGQAERDRAERDRARLAAVRTSERRWFAQLRR